MWYSFVAVFAKINSILGGNFCRGDQVVALLNSNDRKNAFMSSDCRVFVLVTAAFSYFHHAGLRPVHYVHPFFLMERTMR